MIKKFILSRLKEASTWRGIILLVSSAIGYNLDADQQAALVLLALAAVGAVGTFMPDKVAESKPVADKVEVSEPKVNLTESPE